MKLYILCNLFSLKLMMKCNLILYKHRLRPFTYSSSIISDSFDVIPSDSIPVVPGILATIREWPFASSYPTLGTLNCSLCVVYYTFFLLSWSFISDTWLVVTSYRLIIVNYFFSHLVEENILHVPPLCYIFVECFSPPAV